MSSERTPKDVARQTSIFIGVLCSVAVLVVLRISNTLDLWAIAIIIGVVLEELSYFVIYRAIENRRPVLRCSNTGISMVISSSGNITEELPLNQSGVISASIIPNNELTFYSRYGDLIAQLSLLISIYFVINALIRKK